MAKTTNIEQNETYFIADLDNGGVRFGMFDIAAFDFPADHAEYNVVKSVELDVDAEALFDKYFEKYGLLRSFLH